MAKHIVLLCLLLTAIAPAQADDDTVWFLAGMGTALAAHEAGHQLVGQGRINWRGTEWACMTACDGERIAVSGFYSQALVSEAVVRAFDGPDERAFRNGVRVFNTLQPLFYAAHGRRDLENLTPEHRGNARIALVAFAIWSAWHIEF